MGQTVHFEYQILFSDPEQTGNESQKKDAVISSFNKAANKKTDINPNWVQMTKASVRL